MKYTPEDYYDRENLEIALEKAEDICSQVNEGVRSQENSNRLEWLQERVNLEGLEEVGIFLSLFRRSLVSLAGSYYYFRHCTLLPVIYFCKK